MGLLVPTGGKGKCPVSGVATQVRGGRVTPRRRGGQKEALGPRRECPVLGGRDGGNCGPSGPGEVSGRGPSRVSLVRVGPGERSCVCVVYITMDRRAWNRIDGFQGAVTDGSGREKIYPWRSRGSSAESLGLALLAEDRASFEYKCVTDNRLGAVEFPVRRKVVRSCSFATPAPSVGEGLQI